jgi:hypothetical protein
MKCEECGKDRTYWTELHAVKRIDNTPNCGKIFHPTKPKTKLICWECLGYPEPTIRGVKS